MIDLAPKHMELVREILQREVPQCEVRAFGSRVRGTAQPFSDLDLALVAGEKLDWRLLEKVRDAFSESDLPFMVDISDWQSLPDSLRQMIEEDGVLLQAN